MPKQTLPNKSYCVGVFDYFIFNPTYGRPTESYSIRIITRIPRRCLSINRPFSYSEKECGSNDISLHFVESLNVHNTPFQLSDLVLEFFKISLACVI